MLPFCRFDRFSEETQNIGQERVETVNAMADQLIGDRHCDVSVIREWKDDLNEAWQNLLELLVTRREVKFFMFRNLIKMCIINFCEPDLSATFYAFIRRVDNYFSLFSFRC